MDIAETPMRRVTDGKRLVPLNSILSWALCMVVVIMMVGIGLLYLDAKARATRSEKIQAQIQCVSNTMKEFDSAVGSLLINQVHPDDGDLDSQEILARLQLVVDRLDSQQEVCLVDPLSIPTPGTTTTTGG